MLFDKSDKLPLRFVRDFRFSPLACVVTVAIAAAIAVATAATAAATSAPFPSTLPVTTPLPFVVTFISPINRNIILRKVQPSDIKHCIKHNNSQLLFHLNTIVIYKFEKILNWK